ncbi:MAG TPA: hypothetical protein PLX59_01015 [Candidatus Cloacimonadota bacterium]|nr:hypothetical protein [Candidatus Cloacimonadota bacterium]
MPKELYLLVGDKDFYGQARKPWVPLSTKLLVQSLTERGYKVHKHHYHELANSSVIIRDSIVLYSFSQIPNMRLFLKDLIWHLRRLGNLVIPSWDFLLCHENKGYQELLKRELGIDQPKGWYLSNLDALSSYKLSYPLVLKGLEGSNSTQVSLVHNEAELRQSVKAMTKQHGFLTKFDLFRRRYLRGKREFGGWPTVLPEVDSVQYAEYIKAQKRFILQEFVPGLDSDYRVIVFWDKFYVSRRMTKPGDWRASGAKLFTFSKDFPRELLDRTLEVHKIMPSPLISVDLGWKDGKVYLFEFQASHMGMNAVVKNDGYFVQDGTGWSFKERDSSLEADIARAVDLFLQNTYPDRLN